MNWKAALIISILLQGCAATPNQWRNCGGSVAAGLIFEKAVVCKFTAMNF